MTFDLPANNSWMDFASRIDASTGVVASRATRVAGPSAPEVGVVTLLVDSEFMAPFSDRLQEALDVLLPAAQGMQVLVYRLRGSLVAEIGPKSRTFMIIFDDDSVQVSYRPPGHAPGTNIRWETLALRPSAGDWRRSFNGYSGQSTWQQDTRYRQPARRATWGVGLEPTRFISQEVVLSS